MVLRRIMMMIILVSIAGLDGCATIDKGLGVTPMALGLFRSPIYFKSDFGKNGPLTAAQKNDLEKRLSNIQLPGLIPDTLTVSGESGMFATTCNAKNLDISRFSGEACFDNLEDLYHPQNDTLVFVAISGGGARAAVLAQDVFVHLEQKFNDFKKNFIPETDDALSLVDRLHVISTVSGGSLYSYRVARIKTLMENDVKSITDIATQLRHSKTLKDYKSLRDEVFRLHSYNVFSSSCANPSSTFRQLKQIKEPDSDSDANHAAESSANLLAEYLPQLSRAKNNLFECIGTVPSFLDTGNLGNLSGIYYMSPGNLFLGPLFTFFTNETYLSVLAGTLGMSTTINGNMEKETNPLTAYGHLFDPSLYKLSYLTHTPRFLFNATALETGLPFVFTQRMMQLPTKTPLLNTVRLDHLINETSKEIENDELFRLKHPLGKIATLEDLNSSPSDMPLAFAAMASAAFPIGFEPLVLTKYGYDKDQQLVYESQDKFHVSDGGLYDNSGLSTLSELFETIMKVRSLKQIQTLERKLTLILLSVNADADEYDTFYAGKDAKPAGWINKIPFGVGWPIRTEALGIVPLNLIHYVNKRRAEQLAIANFSRILCSGIDNKKTKSTEDTKKEAPYDKENASTSTTISRCNNEQFNFLYFPVNLSQLSSADRYRIPDPSNLYERLKVIPTDFQISGDDEILLSQAAVLLVSSEQKGVGWDKNLEKISGPTAESCKKLNEVIKPKLERLDEAFAFYTLCSAMPYNKKN